MYSSGRGTDGGGAHPFGCNWLWDLFSDPGGGGRVHTPRTGCGFGYTTHPKPPLPPRLSQGRMFPRGDAGGVHAPQQKLAVDLVSRIPGGKEGGAHPPPDWLWLWL